MENRTLERLLRIQGTPRQMKLEERLEEPRSAGSASPMTSSKESAKQNPGKIPPEEVEAWRAIYRYYAKYAPQIRQAALLDDEIAGNVFASASDELNQIYTGRGIIGAEMAIPLYRLLETVFNQEKADRLQSENSKGAEDRKITA